MTVTHPRIYTYDDLATMPDDGNRYEIISGELIVSPAPILDHQAVVGTLYVWLRTFVSRHQLGWVYTAPTDVRLSPHNTVEPDVLFISRDRGHIRRRAFVDGAPDLVAEVLSERTRGIDLVQKRALYAMAGVPEYWLVDLETRTVSVLTLNEGAYDAVEAGVDELARSGVLPEFEVSVADLFAGLMDEA
jgi:Uma2 family endonuclease